MKNLIFATNNEHKVAEIRNSLGNLFQVVSLKEAKINIDIEEPYDTLEENAREKSSTIHRLTKQECFSEDTGLEVDSLNGEPGVNSARYAGDERSFEANIDKLLNNMQHSTNRFARFRTVISLILNGEEKQFEGICKGVILKERRGFNGFGYDPVFVPTGSLKTFAEMDMIEKSIFSHRKKAMIKLINFLQNVN